MKQPIPPPARKVTGVDVFNAIQFLDENEFGQILNLLVEAFSDKDCLTGNRLENLLRLSVLIQHLAELIHPANGEGESAERILVLKMLSEHGMGTKSLSQPVQVLRDMFRELLADLESSRQHGTLPFRRK